MNFSIVTEYSFWWIFPLAALAFVLAFLRYFYKKPYHKNLSGTKVLFLSVLRFLAFLLLFVLLLQPRLSYKSQKIQKPLLVFAQDNSRSLRYTKDSLYYLNQYWNDVEAFLTSLQSKYEIQKLSFGKRTKTLETIDFSEPVTDFSELFDFLRKNYAYSENLQVVLASDGLYNQGSNPRYLTSKILFPVHAVQLGDTLQTNDISIHSVRSNRIGFVNKKLPVRIGIKTQGFASEKIHLQLKNGNDIIVHEEITIQDNSTYIEKDYAIAPKKAGLQKFKLEIQSNKEEQNQRNNHAEFVVDVLDTKRKISICFDQFHPDIAALKSAIDQNLSFSAELVDLSRKIPEIDKANLLILYQIPSVKGSYIPFLQKLKEKKIPTLFVLGGQTNLKELEQIDFGLDFAKQQNLFQQATYAPNKKFSLFALNDEQVNLLEKLPPLLSPFATYQFVSEHEIAAYQKLKSITSSNPLIAFSVYEDQKTGWIFGEGLWRWKLHAFRLAENHKDFNNLINRITQYLSLKIKRGQLMVSHSASYSEGEEIEIKAELYNESYQLVNDTGLEFILTNEEGTSFSYPFRKEDQAYALKIDFLPQGKYNYLVQTKDSGKKCEQSGGFFVHLHSIESKNRQADKAVLFQIANQTEAHYVGKEQFAELANYLMEEEKGRAQAIVSERVEYEDLIDEVYLLFLVIIVMVLEWFLLKFWLGN